MCERKPVWRKSQLRQANRRPAAARQLLGFREGGSRGARLASPDEG
jgi:hypothetical protein